MGAGLLAAFLVLGLQARAQDDEPVAIQRYVESVRLGDYLKEVRLAYPPLRDWPSFRAPGDKLTHYQIERAAAKNFPQGVETMRFALRWGRVVLVQAIFTERRAKERPLEKMVVQLSLRYGEPKRRGMAYTWQDGRTVLRAFNTEISSPGGAVEMRPSIEIYEAALRD
ncbi:MAG: hypothetical protein NTX64_00870 [Elusimicrobia bacterium]|nr:hypothetical protein [Elusimicrobiota bacterium]